MSELRPISTPPVRPARAAKCTRDVKLHLPEALYDDLAQWVRMDQRTVGEYLRKVLERPTYGALSVYRG